MLLMPRRSRKASSIEYTSTAGANSSRTHLTLWDMLPYNAMFPENTATPCFSTRSLILKKGAPILIPRALASLLRAIAQPSLLESTMMGFPCRSGLKTLSQETKKLLQSASANMDYIFFMTHVTTPQIMKLLSGVISIGLYVLLFSFAGIRRAEFSPISTRLTVYSPSM